MRIPSFMALALLMLAAGCHSSVSGDSAVSFVQPDNATVFLYATYGSADNAPTFAETFTFRANKGYIDDVDDGQYIQIQLPSGKTVFDVDEVEWAGYVRNHAALTMNLQKNRTYYIAETVSPDYKSTLLNIDPARGAQEIAARKRACVCD